jgi:hypothetical protein
MRRGFLKALLWLVCITHVLSGIAGIASPAIALEVARVFYGATLELTPVSIHLLRIIGAYMLMMGVLGAVAAYDPDRNRPIITTLAILLLIRVLQRVFLAGEIHETFGISYNRIWFQAAYFAAIAIALLALMPRRKPDTETAVPV